MAPEQSSGLGVAALILGILSYAVLPLVAGVAAIVLGVAGRKAADEGRASGRGMATAGLVLGAINLGLSVLVVVVIVLIAMR